MVKRVPTDFGKTEFESSCASCHGIRGKGNGPLVPLLTRRPTDLTLLAKNNQGVFPTGCVQGYSRRCPLPSVTLMLTGMPAWTLCVTVQKSSNCPNTRSRCASSAPSFPS